MEYIRQTYGVPAKRGMKITYTYPNPSKQGVITGSSGAHLRIKLDGEKRAGRYHPTWEIQYHAEAIES